MGSCRGRLSRRVGRQLDDPGYGDGRQHQYRAAHVAIAHEAGIAYGLERINQLSCRTPNVCRVAPSSHYHIEDVHNSGGISTILGSIHRGRPDLLQLACPTVTGKTLGENIAEYDVHTRRQQEALELAAVTAGGPTTSKG